MSLVERIVEYEWNMLQALNSEQKHLECKNNKYMFLLMRKSQWLIYPLSVHSAYMNDLYRAVSEKRNLLFEKYAYMLKHTHPSKFKEIEGSLPLISIEKRHLIDRIIENHKIWESEVHKELPATIKYGRNCDCSKSVSSMIYLDGELSSYSVSTLMEIFRAEQIMMDKKINGIIEILKNYIKYQ